MTLTPSGSCMWVPLCSNRATCCFDTAREEIGRRRLGFRRVLLVENEHKLQLIPDLFRGLPPRFCVQ
jgi:hypothetical protein